MRYKAGDRVRVRKNLVVGNVYGGVLFDKKMCSWLGKIVEISEVYTCYYHICDGALFVWTDDMLEPITDLTTSEVVAFGQVMCDSAHGCSACPFQEVISKYNGCGCRYVKHDHSDEYIDTVTKWVVGDAGKKEISIEKCSYLVIMDTDRNIVYEEQLKVGNDYGAVFKRYCEEHDGIYYAIIECRLGVKED